MQRKLMKFVKQIGLNNKYFFFLFFNLGILFFIIRFCSPIYETNDDFTISLVSMGVFGDNYRQCLPFSNVIYGFIIKFISYIFPSLNWWIVLQYLIIVLSYSALFYLLSVKTNLSIALLGNMTVGCLVIYSEIRNIQFTRTAFIACIAGLVLVVYGNIHNSKKAVIIGFVMSLTGSWIRENTFWISVVYIIAFLVAYIFHMDFNLHMIKKLARQLGIMIMLVVIGSFINMSYYEGSTEWNEYMQFNSARASLLDYSMPSWEENKEKYESIGFSENDIRLFAKWNFNDSNKFSLQNLSAIVSWKTKDKIDINGLKNLLKKIFGSIQQSYFVLWIISLIVVLAVQSKGGRMLCLFNFVGTIIIFLYFYYKGRMLPRVEFGIWACAILVNFLGFFEFKEQNRADICNPIYGINHYCVKVGAILGMVLFIFSKGMLFEGTSIYEGATRDLLSYLTESSSKRYILDIESLQTACFSFCPYKRVDSFYLQNYCWSGGWDTFAPYWRSYNEVLGFDNPLEDLCTKDNVFYVTDRDIGVLYTYLQENYQATSVELVETYELWNIYKFY